MNISEATYYRVVACLERIRSYPDAAACRSWAYEALDALRGITIDNYATREDLQKLLDDFDNRHPSIAAIFKEAER